MSTQNEKPIIFSSKMILAILKNRKSQTRRPIKNLDNSQWETSLFEAGRWKEAIKCPYGQSGDRLWVRETWQYNPFGGIVYRAGSGIVDCDGKGWRSPIYMPKSVSRITLEILNIRVERVQDIIQDDIYAEGCPLSYDLTTAHGKWFKTLWDSIYSKKGFGWDINPWVWMIGFKKIT